MIILVLDLLSCLEASDAGDTLGGSMAVIICVSFDLNPRNCTFGRMNITVMTFDYDLTGVGECPAIQPQRL